MRDLRPRPQCVVQSVVTRDDDDNHDDNDDVCSVGDGVSPRSYLGSRPERELVCLCEIISARPAVLPARLHHVSGWAGRSCLCAPPLLIILLLL